MLIASIHERNPLQIKKLLELRFVIKSHLDGYVKYAKPAKTIQYLWKICKTIQYLQYNLTKVYNFDNINLHTILITYA